MFEDPSIECNLDDLLCLQLDGENDHNSMNSSHLQSHVLSPKVFHCVTSATQTAVGRETESQNAIDVVTAPYSSYMSYLLEDDNFSSSPINVNEYETESMALQLQENLLHDFPNLKGGYCGSSIGMAAFKSKYLSDDRDAYNQQFDYSGLEGPNSHLKPVYSLAYSSPAVESHQKRIPCPESEEVSTADHLLDPESPSVDSLKNQIKTDSVSPTNDCDMIGEEEFYHQERQLAFPVDSPPTERTAKSTLRELNQKTEMGKQKRLKKIDQPKYAFKTRSDTDILDDGYKWRKYGQKAVKNNSHPRSYYRC
eukprot:c23665_g2_i1 orf=216-1142(+)